MKLAVSDDGKNEFAPAIGYVADSGEFFYHELNLGDLADGGAVTTTFHSGLPCLWRNRWPVLPKLMLWNHLGLGVKRAFDMVASGSSLVILSPVFLLTAMAIKINDPAGPVFFCQDRVGHKGQVLKVYKFRTMYAKRGDASGVVQTKIDDDRVTSVGRLLRNKGIDELPQLLNVLQGNMSLVGPRPHVPGQLANGDPYKNLVPYYDLRHVAKPGITGWAQVNGLRGPTEDRQLAVARIEHDMTYVQNRSLWLDMVIILLTVWREFIHSKAH